MGNGLDSAKAITADAAKQLKAQEYSFVGRYGFHTSGYKDVLTQSEAETIHGAGLKVVSIWESGYPTSAGYFTESSGEFDGIGALARFQPAGQPIGGVVFATVDFDAQENDLQAIGAYFEAFRDKLHGTYTTGIYGNGLVCQYLSEVGLVSHTWLSGSKGWTDYEYWRNRANIVQGVTETVDGLSVDLDFTGNGDIGAW